MIRNPGTSGLQAGEDVSEAFVSTAHQSWHRNWHRDFVSPRIVLLPPIDPEARKLNGTCLNGTGDYQTARGPPGLLTAREKTPVSDIVEMMIDHDISRVPVVRDGKLVGVVTRADLLKTMAPGRGVLADARC